MLLEVVKSVALRIVGLIFDNSFNELIKVNNPWKSDSYCNPSNAWPIFSFIGLGKDRPLFESSKSLEIEVSSGIFENILPKKSGKNWIKGAIKKPGALKATAKRAGAMKADGTIKKSWLREKAKGSGKTAQRARLALTLGKMKK